MKKYSCIECGWKGRIETLEESSMSTEDVYCPKCDAPLNEVDKE